ncbi:hypothetical protein BH11MYX1_BH11MYX1_32910 [soil metagenome]
MKHTLPIALGMLVGCYMVVEYFIPHYAAREISGHVLEWGGLVAAAAYVVGGINLVQVTWPKIRRREEDWGYKVVLLASAAIMTLVGLPWRSITGTTREPGYAMKLAPNPDLYRAGKARVLVVAPADVVISLGSQVTTTAELPACGCVEVNPGELAIKASRRAVGYDVLETKLHLVAGDVAIVSADPQMGWGANGRVRTWCYDYVYGPCNATMFALLAFFVASAAFRAFRARNIDAALLLGSAIIVLLAQAPIGRWLTTSLPHLADWILDVLSNGSRRAIIMGAAVGAIATGLRVILGIERSHLGGE